MSYTIGIRIGKHVLKGANSPVVFNDPYHTSVESHRKQVCQRVSIRPEEFEKSHASKGNEQSFQTHPSSVILHLAVCKPCYCPRKTSHVKDVPKTFHCCIMTLSRWGGHFLTRSIFHDSCILLGTTPVISASRLKHIKIEAMLYDCLC